MKYFCAVLLAVGGFSAFGQGNLTPPGAPAPTMKTLSQIEPRTPISSLPFYIYTAGSYYLTTNLVGDPSNNGISVMANDVSIDLNGYSLTGGSNAVVGILVFGAWTNVAVFNGIIRNWSEGIEALNCANARYDGVQFANNNLGLWTGPGGIIRNCSASGNGSHGFNIDQGSVISECVARSNGGAGFFCNNSVLYRCTAFKNVLAGISSGEGSTVSECTAGSNKTGISSATGTTIVNCTARGNTNDGIYSLSGGTVRSCTTSGNGNGITGGSGTTIMECTSYNNVTNGIEAGSGAVVVNNQCYSNGTGAAVGAGIKLIFNGSRVEGNNVNLNDVGIDASGAGNVIIRNTAQLNSGNSSNYVFAGGNSVGPTNITSGVVTNHPWANFSF